MNNIVEKLTEHEKMMYERLKTEKNRVVQERNMPLVSPLNDMIDFNPFQYIPYAKLRLQENYPKVVYIADEVGAGKTIETGIILTELIYKNEINLSKDKCIIICPNLLCHKWKNTLKTFFGINAVIVHSLEDILNGINIVSFDTVSTTKEADLKDLKIKIKMLIIDEAHNASGARNENIMEVRKKVCQESGYVVCLSATPVGGDVKDAQKQIALLKGEDSSGTIGIEDFFVSENDNEILCKNRKKYMRYADNPDKYQVETVVKNHFIENDSLKQYMDISKELFAGKNTIMLFQGLNAIMSSPAAANSYLKKILDKSPEELLEYLQSSNEYSEDDESEDDFDDDDFGGPVSRFSTS
jgi:superfamily II DNA or RNA helicase